MFEIGEGSEDVLTRTVLVKLAHESDRGDIFDLSSIRC